MFSAESFVVPPSGGGVCLQQIPPEGGTTKPFHNIYYKGLRHWLLSFVLLGSTQNIHLHYPQTKTISLSPGR
jgi:hypothetical protein